MSRCLGYKQIMFMAGLGLLQLPVSDDRLLLEECHLAWCRPGGWRIRRRLNGY